MKRFKPFDEETPSGTILSSGPSVRKGEAARFPTDGLSFKALGAAELLQRELD